MVDLNKGIRREVTRLSERWSALLVHAGQWQAKLDDMLPVSNFKILKLHIGCMHYQTINFIFIHFILNPFFRRCTLSRRAQRQFFKGLGKLKLVKKLWRTLEILLELKTRSCFSEINSRCVKILQSIMNYLPCNHITLRVLILELQIGS